MNKHRWIHKETLQNEITVWALEEYSSNPAWLPVPLCLCLWMDWLQTLIQSLHTAVYCGRVFLLSSLLCAPQSCFSFSAIFLVRVSKYRAEMCFGVPSNRRQDICCNCRWRIVDGEETAAASACFYPAAYLSLPECWSGYFSFANYLFEYILRTVSLTHHTWRQVQALVSVLSPPLSLENLTFLQKKKKRSAHILSSLDQGKKRGLWQRLSYGSPTHELSLTETGRQAGRHAAAFYMALVLSLWWHCLE